MLDLQELLGNEAPSPEALRRTRCTAEALLIGQVQLHLEDLFGSEQHDMSRCQLVSNN